VKQSTYYKSLPVILTAEEFETKSTQLADICKEIQTEKDREKTRAKSVKEAIEKKEYERANLADVVKDKCEDRSVECSDRYNFHQRMVESVRMDTGEVFATRAMELKEYQEEMDLRQNPLVAFRTEDSQARTAEA
jgi:hypothetical protein